MLRNTLSYKKKKKKKKKKKAADRKVRLKRDDEREE
jgi:hypothetical protein